MTGHQDDSAPAPTPLRVNSLRLLPWSSPEGNPCFLSTDGRGSMMSRLADDVEEAQTGVAAEVLDDAAAILAERKADVSDLRRALARVMEALGDMLRVAESRGARLSVSDDDDDQDGGPELPAETAV
ncbi:hypothetical protein [Streptomyces corynorhini]|uniref:Uncharacterized protein n=1 Tax=Streptomyces corynorhini TaxID=2282652 RepID=A0A370B3V3_9ACTN|nr:hypothetical protein [Streptomyces corynorhini]RDG36490.1 hypothetical protein DVH02_19755 [Streptomyces corynorhini]